MLLLTILLVLVVRALVGDFDANDIVRAAVDGIGRLVI